MVLCFSLSDYSNMIIIIIFLHVFKEVESCRDEELCGTRERVLVPLLVILTVS